MLEHTHLTFTVQPSLTNRTEQRRVERELWDKLRGPKPPTGFICNACTVAPDYFYGHPIWVACIIHDWHYSTSSPYIGRLSADWKFAKNIYTVVRHTGGGRFRAVRIAAYYTSGTGLMGYTFFRKTAAKIDKALQFTEDHLMRRKKDGD